LIGKNRTLVHCITKPRVLQLCDSSLRMNAMQLILILLGVARLAMALQRGSSVGQAEQLFRTSTEGSGQKITAKYGKNCGSGKDVTDKLLAACTDPLVTSCEWKMDDLGPDPYHGCAKNMDIELECGAETINIHVGGEAGGGTVFVGCPAQCPAGWVQMGEIGADIPGWGLSRDGNKADNIADCAAQCTADSPRCGSFEFTERTSDCALYHWKDTNTDKQTNRVEGMIMCQMPPPSCPAGYSQLGVLGNDVPGWGLASDGNQAASVEACAAQCDARSDCGSFEFVGGDCGLLSVDTSESSFSGTVYNMLTCQKPPPCECPAEPSGHCSGWGDPHYTASFYAGNSHFDHYGLAVYQMAKSKDGSFEVQVFQCPWANGSIGTSMNFGYAIKSGSTVVNIIADKVYRDDQEIEMTNSPLPFLTGSMAGSPRNGFCMSSSDGNGTSLGCINMHYTPEPIQPMFSTEFNIQMLPDAIDPSTGTCAVEACKNHPWGNCKISCSASLFTSAAIAKLTNLCAMPANCDDPEGYVPIVDPTEACDRTGMDIAAVEQHCASFPAEFQSGCIIDCCAGGDIEKCSEMETPSTPSPPCDGVITPAPTESTPSPTTAPVSTESPTPSPVSPEAPTPSPTCTDGTTGTCEVSEDPHVSVFDGAQISLIQQLVSKETRSDEEAGDKWLVKSNLVSIQARYIKDPLLPDRNLFVRAIAVGGAFVRGNVIVIGSFEDNSTFNGRRILTEPQSDFEFVEGDFFVKAKRSNNSSLVQDESKRNQGVDVELPMGVNLVINRLHHHVNILIKMPPQEGGQEGLCGNFNGLAGDDALELSAKRFDMNVAPADSLFKDLDFE